MKYLFVCFLVILVPGCASINNRLDPSRISLTQVPSNSGIIIISAGAPKRCVTTSTFLKVLPATSKYNNAPIALLGVDSYALKSDFADHQGNVHTLALPAGDYYLAAWIANPYVTALRVPKADFSIRAGEVVYMGEYFMDVACAWNTVSNYRDQRERDLLILRIKNPELGNTTIITRIPRFSGYAVGAEN